MDERLNTLIPSGFKLGWSWNTSLDSLSSPLVSNALRVSPLLCILQAPASSRTLGTKPTDKCREFFCFLVPLQDSSAFLYLKKYPLEGCKNGTGRTIYAFGFLEDATPFYTAIKSFAGFPSVEQSPSTIENLILSFFNKYTKYLGTFSSKKGFSLSVEFSSFRPLCIISSLDFFLYSFFFLVTP